MDARIARKAPAEILIAARRRGEAGAAEALILRLVPHHRVFEEIANLGEAVGLVVMGVDIDDEEILIAPLDRLLVRMRQQRLGVEGFDREIAIIDGIHVLILACPLYSAATRAARRFAFTSEMVGSKLKTRFALPP